MDEPRLVRSAAGALLLAGADAPGFAMEQRRGHGARLFVPVLAAYIAWQLREEFLAVPAKPSWWGLVLVIYAGFQLCVATLGAELFLQRTAIVLSIIGAVWFVRGTRRLIVMSFRLFLLFFM